MPLRRAALHAIVVWLSPLACAQDLDPAAWGSSHAGKPVPEFIHGDECLFCHRNDIGSRWQKNAHGITIRQRKDAPSLAVPPALASQVEYFLGGRNHVRYLKKDGYGKLAIFTAAGAWDRSRFADACAGCHATAVEAATRTFAYYGLDCYTCHGVVDLNHTRDTSLILLSKKNAAPARVVTSICAQCHLRGGKSRSTGLPYANNFVAGDNLFQDFQVDFSLADRAELNPGDLHVWRNVGDVVLRGSGLTCLGCHSVHGSSSAKHRRVLSGPICLDCHYEGKPRKEVRSYTVRSATCEY